ncbi:LppA family lipoprotein [Mycoplasma putrefaciens]|uniref:Uncharacterized protein n=1 Tax=Mycoplasma putrefaciens Mput9231 TaxID=1292033 RepID=M9WHU6_9MOLU|nr:LppA family lipoprotein [Mycoplasma putrefaciens]AGJ91040.1 Hypothetical protein, predicted lipoprotein [Mycoplasma putrefaciens Mput9231]
MKKVNKFLAALPAIFITSLSAISCTNKPNKIDIDNNNNNNNGVNKPDNNHKKPDSQNNPVEDFKDLDSLKTEIDFQHYNFYKEKDPITAWSSLKNDTETISKSIFEGNIELKNKYRLEVDSNTNPSFDQENGVINNVSIKFIKTISSNSQSVTKKFTFKGFKGKENNFVNNKNDYLIQKELDENLKGIFPSMMAYMLLYFENVNEYEKLQASGNVINFEELKNVNHNLFRDKFGGFSVGTKELLFDYKDGLEKLYKNKITQASFDDINGILKLSIDIQNSDNSSREPSIVKEFTFKGFRKANFKNPEQNVISIFLTQSDFREIIKTTNIEKIIKNIVEKSNNTDNNISVENNSHFNEFLTKQIKREVLKKLKVTIIDNEHSIYNSTQTLAIQNQKNGNERSILGLNGNMSLYPFNTQITSDSIKEIYLNYEKENKKLKIEFNLEIPFYSTPLSDLRSHAVSLEKKILLKTTSQYTLN